MNRFSAVFGDRKPVIAMVHFGALPGSPLHDAEGGLGALLEGARKDLTALELLGPAGMQYGPDAPRHGYWHLQVVNLHCHLDRPATLGDLRQGLLPVLCA